MESAYLIKSNKTLDLSEQQLVDCVYARSGCNGGWMGTAYRQIIERGIETETNYPYTKKYSGSCLISGGPIKLNKYKTSKRDKCGILRRWTKRTPLAVALAAGGWGDYDQGVFTDCQTSVNHAVLLVGYDKRRNWIIKNSWGASWGEDGYMTISRKNDCKICQYGGDRPFVPKYSV